jgi:hypothetical protein
VTAVRLAPKLNRDLRVPLGLRGTAAHLTERLAKGEHLVLWGPIGSGKTTLATTIQRQLAGGACACSKETRCLDDITQALERAYPQVPTQTISRRAARARLWQAADREPAVLLLDHVMAVSTAMKGFLRRLRGGVAGVLLIFDIDSAREGNRLRALHLGCLSLRMPAFPSRVQHVLLAALWPVDQHPSPGPTAVRRLIRAARGRPGWIRICAQLARDPKYWCAEGVKVRALALDSELLLRRTSPLEPTQKRQLLFSTLN